MRILFVTNRYPSAEDPGDSPCIQEQQNALQALGHTVDVLVISKRESWTKWFRAMWQVFKDVQLRDGYDIVHAHYGYCGVVARTQFRRPVVVTFRGSDVYARGERMLSRLVARIVDQSIVMTEDMKQRLERQGIVVIPYGIDTDLFKPQPADAARRELGLSPTAPLVLFPYDPRRRLKRYDLVEQALQRLKAEFPEVQILSMYHRTHEDVVRFMNACDAMVLASDSEGAPVAIREAMACNLPIVSVNVGDVAEVMRDTAECYLAERNPEDIAAKLSLVLRRRQRTNGRNKALKMSIAHSASSVAAVYERLLSGRGRVAALQRQESNMKETEARKTI